MQDKAKPRPFHMVDRTLRLELGAGAEEVFAEFSAEATAAASLAQVRWGPLRWSGVEGCRVRAVGRRGQGSRSSWFGWLMGGLMGSSSWVIHGVEPRTQQAVLAACWAAHDIHPSCSLKGGNFPARNTRCRWSPLPRFTCL